MCAPKTGSLPPTEPASTSSDGVSLVASTSSTLAALASPGGSATLASDGRLPADAPADARVMVVGCPHVCPCVEVWRHWPTQAHGQGCMHAHTHTHTHTRARCGEGTIIIMFIAPSRVDSADGRIVTSRSKASLLAGHVDYRQVAGRTTHTRPRQRAVTEAEGGGGVETEAQ